MKTEEIFEDLFSRYSKLQACRETIKKSYKILETCYEHGKKLLLCGNGGSASDCEHIVGELMKGFLLPRKVESSVLAGKKLQYGLPAISLVSQSSLISAVANDNGESMVFAQQVMGYGNAGDVILGISTSGNSENVVLALELAKERGLFTIALTGEEGGRLGKIVDCCITVPEVETYKVQELHLPIYHCLCMMLEQRFFG
ncbi:MAG: SIS domain-containing protein [Sphaerochaetaceae bacterium]